MAWEHLSGYGIVFISEIDLNQKNTTYGNFDKHRNINTYKSLKPCVMNIVRILLRASSRQSVSVISNKLLVLVEFILKAKLDLLFDS